MFERRKEEGTKRSFGSRATGGARNSHSTERERTGMFSRRSPIKNVRNQRPVKADKPARPGLFSRWDWGRVRLWVVGVFFCLLWMSLWSRAYYLQIVMGPEYAERARRQHTAKEIIAGVRGNIMDRNGNILAQSVDCRSVSANPAMVPDKQATAFKLAQALNEPPGRIAALLEEKRQFVWIARKLDYHVAEKVKALNLPGISLDSEFERVYPYKHLAGQLLGFVNIDDKGLEGLEKSFEGKLAGRTVTQLVERDASGRRLMTRETGDIRDLRGQDVRLSLDLQVQFFAEEALAESVTKYEAKWGGCIVVDVPTGDILAWAQYPFFDPNNVQAVAVADRRNRLAMDMLEQGSTIKSFLIAAALEEKVVSPSTEINCEKGAWKLRNIILHDTHPYANLTVDKILHVSSNIGAAKIGLKLGATKYRDYLMRLGFGERTRLPLASEAKGILRTTRKWSDIDLANASFGQSFSATLVQMAQAYLSLANNGEKKALRLIIDEHEPGPGKQEESAGQAQTAANPSVERAGEFSAGSGAGVAFAATGSSAGSAQASAATAAASGSPSATGSASGGVSGPAAASGAPSVPTHTASGERIFSPATTKLVRSMMREVVEEDGGTGKAARIPGIDIGGKTGTAQKAARTGGYGKGRVGSFVGLVPIEEPRYLILVLLDEPTTVQYGGIIAAPVFKHVAMNTLAYQGLLPDGDDPQIQEAVRKAEERKARAEGKGKKQTRPAQTAATLEPAKNSQTPGGKNSAAQASGQPVKGAPAGGKAGMGQTVAASGPASRSADPAVKSSGQPGSGGNNVPSVLGLGMRNAVEAFAAEGIVPIIKGKGGIVVRQSPEPGIPWPNGKKECTLWLEERTT